MSKKKKHHYIPQFYLSYFTENDVDSKITPFLWVFSKDKLVAFKKSPRNVGFEKYFYAYDDGEELSFEIEDILSQVESDVVKIFKGLVHRKFDFDDVKKRFLFGKFVSFMNFRTIKSREHLRILTQNTVKSNFMEKMNLDGGVAKILQNNDKPWPAREFIDSFNKMKIIPTRAFSLDYMMQAVNKMIPYLCIRNWLFLIPDSPDNHFVTSDNPVLLRNKNVRDKNYIPGILDENTDIIFPVFPNMCLYASFNVKECFWKIPSMAVKTINNEIAGSCHKYLFSSTPDINSLFN